MTSLSRRKPRTTAPRTRAAGTAARLALALAFATTAGTVFAQYPPRSAPPPGTQPKRPAAPGAGGKVLYFHKPADALAPQGEPAGGVAQAAPILRPVGAIPDVPALPLLPQPAPAAPPVLIPDRTIALPPAAVPAARPIANVPPAAAVPGTIVLAQGGAQPLYKPIEVPAGETRRPNRDDVFTLNSDAEMERVIVDQVRAEFRKRMIKNALGTKRTPEDIERDLQTLSFPDLPRVGDGTAYRPKTADYPAMRVNYEPGYVTHRRLHFEEKNSERYGWDLGIVQPFVSTLFFYKDVLLWPNSLASGCAYGFWDVNAGKCLPGSPTPYFLYPPGLTITGTAAEGLLITGAAFAFP